MLEERKRIIAGFHKGLQEIETRSGSRMEKANNAIILCHRSLLQLRAEVIENGFATKESEIHFFKNIKVIPQSCLYYYEKVLSFESLMPPISIKRQRKFLEGQMDAISAFFMSNTIYINYLRLKRTDLDDRYYTRKHLKNNALLPTHSTQYDPEFNTMRDVLLAQVRANYRYMEYLNRIMAELHLSPAALKEEASFALDYVGNKIDLVELIYALHAAKVFKGEPDISAIQRAVERLFDVRLGIIYTRFQQIQGRSGERLKFLPRLVSALAGLLEKKEGLDGD